MLSVKICPLVNLNIVQILFANDAEKLAAKSFTGSRKHFFKALVLFTANVIANIIANSLRVRNRLRITKLYAANTSSSTTPSKFWCRTRRRKKRAILFEIGFFRTVQVPAPTLAKMLFGIVVLFLNVIIINIRLDVVAKLFGNIKRFAVKNDQPHIHSPIACNAIFNALSLGNRNTPLDISGNAIDSQPNSRAFSRALR